MLGAKGLWITTIILQIHIGRVAFCCDMLLLPAPPRHSSKMPTINNTCLLNMPSVEQGPRVCMSPFWSPTYYTQYTLHVEWVGGLPYAAAREMSILMVTLATLKCLGMFCPLTHSLTHSLTSPPSIFHMHGSNAWATCSRGSRRWEWSTPRWPLFFPQST